MLSHQFKVSGQRFGSISFIDDIKIRPVRQLPPTLVNPLFTDAPEGGNKIIVAVGFVYQDPNAVEDLHIIVRKVRYAINNEKIILIVSIYRHSVIGADFRNDFSRS